MSYLLDTDTVSTYLKQPTRLAHRFIQHSGRLAIPSIVLAELYAGAQSWPSCTPGPICGAIPPRS